MSYLVQRFVFRQAGIAAVNTRVPQALQLINRGADVMQVKMHGLKESSSRTKVETRERNQHARLKIIVANGEFQLAHFKQCAGILQILKAIAVIELLQLAVKA